MKTLFRKYASVMLLMAAALVTGCNDETEDRDSGGLQGDPKLEILSEGTSFSFASSDNEKQELKFKANRNWKISVSEEEAKWLEFSATSGLPKGDEAVIVTIKANDLAEGETDARQASFTLFIANTDIKHEFSIYQAQKDVVVISNPDEFKKLAYTEQEIEVEFATNIADYEVSCTFAAGDGTWIEPIPAVKSAMSNHKLKFRVLANTTIDQRTATINIASKVSAVKGVVEVTQEGKPVPTISIENKDALAAAELSKTAGEVVLDCKIVMIDDLVVGVEYQGGMTGWLTQKGSISADGKLTFTYLANANFNTRTATIKLSSAANSLSDEVILTQAADKTINVGGGTSLADALTAKGLSQENVDALEIVGELTAADWALLKTMASSKSLKDIDLAGVTNTTIPNSAFMNCTKLETLILPTNGNITYIPWELCRNDANLKEIKIPEGVKYIDRHAFAACSGLKEIWLPKSLEYSYGYTFEKTGIKKIHLKSKPIQVLVVMRGTDSKTAKASIFGSPTDLPYDATLYVPSNLVALYKNQNPKLSDFGWDDWVTYDASWHNEINNKNFLWTREFTEVIAED